MTYRRKLLIAGLVAAPLLAGGFVAQERSTADGARLLDQVLTIVSNRFVDSVAAAQLYEKAARGLVHELNDPYSVLLSPKELATFNAQTGGKYGGVGMEIGEVQGFVTVQRVFPHTPAEQAGVIEGDRIVQVDTADTRGWTTGQVSDVLKGRPGTKVAVKFLRAGVAEPIPINFTRADVRIPAVPYFTLAAKSLHPQGAWTKQRDLVPFRTKPGTYYADTASPGQIVKQGDEYLMFFSAAAFTEQPKKRLLRTLSIARTKLSIAADNNAGRTIGNVMRQAICRLLEPATRADSSREGSIE